MYNNNKKNCSFYHYSYSKIILIVCQRIEVCRGVFHFVLKVVEVFPSTAQLCEIMSCFLPASQSFTWSTAAISQGEIATPLMLQSKFHAGISDLSVPARTLNY